MPRGFTSDNSDEEFVLVIGDTSNKDEPEPTFLDIKLSEWIAVFIMFSLSLISYMDRSRSAEMEFQQAFLNTSLPSAPFCPRYCTKSKVNFSPKQVTVTPLHMEILEREMSDLKIQHQEKERRNVYLSAIVDEQEIKLERYERKLERERERGIQANPELLRKLDDAQALIRRLRRENSDLGRESSASSTGYTNCEFGSYHSRDGATQHQSQKTTN